MIEKVPTSTFKDQKKVDTRNSSSPESYDEWDKQIEKDIKAGKLDKLAAKALKNFENGDYSEL